MKKHILPVFALAAALWFSGCDIVDDPVKTSANGCTIAEPTFTPRNNPVKKILVEDFTGHRCGNCPRAAEKIHDLETQYGDQIIAIAYHSELSGYFTGVEEGTNKYTYDYRTSTAKDIDTRFGISGIGIPRGMINRTDNGQGKSSPPNTWTGQISALVNQAPAMDVQLKNAYDAIEGTLCAYTYVQGLQASSGTFRLVVYLVENDFTNWQKDYNNINEDIANYNHSHIFRTNLTTVWGKEIKTGTMNPGEETVIGFSIPFDANKWNPDNCYVVAFVYNEDNGQVIQAEKMAVK